jgi:hypothetical protein
MELGVLPMALRILILVCSLTVPAVKPPHRDALPAGERDLLSCKSTDVRPTDGHSHPLVGCGTDFLLSSPLLSDRDEDGSEDEIQVPAFAIRQVGGIDLANTLFLPAPPSPFVAHFSSWRPPLRC